MSDDIRTEQEAQFKASMKHFDILFSEAEYEKLRATKQKRLSYKVTLPPLTLLSVSAT